MESIGSVFRKPIYLLVIEDKEKPKDHIVIGFNYLIISFEWDKRDKDLFHVVMSNNERRSKKIVGS